MQYKLLGYAVWRGARWYALRRLRRVALSRRIVAGALVASAVGAIAVVASQRSCD